MASRDHRLGRNRPSWKDSFSFPLLEQLEPRLLLSTVGVDAPSIEAAEAIEADLNDHTDFGGAVINESVTRQFTITNTGQEPLELSGSPNVRITGPDSSDFQVVDYPDASVPVGGQTTFDVSFTPSSLGLREATISIENNGVEQSPYNIDTQGAGVVVVNFPDANLQQVIREAIGKPTGDILDTDLAQLTHIEAAGRGIIDLTGLEYCTNLRYMGLSNNGVADLAPLSSLTGLRELNIEINPISNFSLLSGLTALEHLYLGWSQMNDLSPLVGLTGLKSLSIRGNPISDFSPLSSLTGLEFLDLQSSQISDLSPLGDLTELEMLWISYSPLSDISPLSGLTGLRWLHIWGTLISDVSPLGGLTGLEELKLGDNQISDINPLSGLTGLWELDLTINPLWPSAYATVIPWLESQGVWVNYDYPWVFSGSVFDDQNSNGAWDAEESGKPGVSVYMDSDGDNVLDWIDTDAQGDWDEGEGERWTASGADGSYRFDYTHVDPYWEGGHDISPVIPAGWRRTTPDYEGQWDGEGMGGIDFGLSDELGPPVLSIEMDRYSDFEVPDRTDDSCGYWLEVVGVDMTGGQLTTPWGQTVDIDELLPAGWNGASYVEVERGAFLFEAYLEDGRTVFWFEWEWLIESQWASLDMGETTLSIVADSGTWSDMFGFSGVPQISREPNPFSPVHRTILPHDFLVEWSPWTAPPTGGIIGLELDKMWSDDEEEWEFDLPATATSWTPPAGLVLDGMYELEIYFADITQQTLDDGVAAVISSSSENDIVCLIGDFEGPIITEPGTGKQYFLTPHGSWETCQVYAEAHGGNLVTIDDADHEAWLRSEFGWGESYWIGLNDRAVEGQWEWADGQPVAYTNWQDGEPDGVDWWGSDADVALWIDWSDQWMDTVGEEDWTRGIVQVNPGQWVQDDHGNSPIDATDLVGPGLATGVLGYRGDIDYFSFSAVEGTLYEILVDMSGNPEMDTTLWLYDSDGQTLLTWDDDGGAIWAGRIRWVAPADGTYYLAVDSIEISEGVIPYSVQISTETLIPDSPTATFDHPELGLLGIRGTRGVAFSRELKTGAASHDDETVLHVLDLSNPLAPVEMGSWYAGGAEGVAFGPHGFLYCVVSDLRAGDDVSSELVALDISGGGDPVEVYRTTLQREGVDSLVIVGDFAYVGTQSNGVDWVDAALEIYDLSNPAGAVLQGQVQWSSPHAGGSSFDPSSVVVVDGVAYVLHDEDYALSLVDVSDPAAPALLGQYAMSLSDPELWDMAAADGMVWIGVGSELRGIDVSDPTNPAPRSSLAMDGKPDKILIQGTTAYVGCISLGLTVVDISDPDSPSILRTVVTPGATGSVAISGEYAFVPTFGDETAIFSGIVSPEVVARRVFYNNSRWDGNDPAAGSSDDGAIAPGKTAMLPGETASPANYTGYWRGINGIMVDIGGISTTRTIGDFGFRVSAPGGWTAGPVPTLTVRAGEGVGSSDRVMLIWSDDAIVDQWVEVTVLAGANTGLAADDVFYFANTVGDCDGDGDVDSSDCGTLVGEFGRRSGIGAIAADLNVDGRVGLADFAIMRGRFGDTVPLPTFPATAPETPAAAPSPALQAVIEPIAQAAAPVLPVVSQPLDGRDVHNANDDSIAAAASAPAVDLLMEPPSAAGYISGSQAISVGSSATMLHRAVTGGYDLRSLSDDLSAGRGDDLLADILAESPLAVLPCSPTY